MSKNPPFIYGTGDEKDPLYALYLPVKNLFIGVHHDIGLLKKLRILLSSKCNTIIIEISSSPEYYHTIIDNSVCENWTISDQTMVDFQDSGIHPDVIPGADLGIKQHHQNIDQDIQNLKNFIQPCMRLLERIITIQDRNLRDIILDLKWFPLYLDLESLDILSFYHDQLAVGMQNQLKTRFDDIDLERKKVISKCEEIIYWARDPDELHFLLDQQTSPISKLLQCH